MQGTGLWSRSSCCETACAECVLEKEEHIMVSYHIEMEEPFAA